jgi:hypothetical protein
MSAIDADWGEGIDWASALQGRERAARALLGGFDRQIRGAFRDAAGPFGGALDTLLRKGTRALHLALGSHFGPELESLADAVEVEVEDLIVANLAYDLSHAVGCSTFVAAGKTGPLHARTLDWSFPGQLLRTHTTAMRIRGGPAGNYAMVGWPGFFGALTGVAPGRFSVTVNYVAHASESSLGPALRRAVEGYWPVPWAVRLALDERKTFAEAVRYLSVVPLLSPVLFTVAGTKPGEAVTIERGPDDYFQRKRDDGLACTANHYVSDVYESENVDLDETSSIERYDQLDERLGRSSTMTAAEALKVLSKGWVNDGSTQHRVVMSAAEGLLVVQIPGRTAVSVPLRS